MSWLPAAIPVQHPVAISTASAAADIFNIANQSTAVFMTLCTREKDCCTKQLSLCYNKAVWVGFFGSGCASTLKKKRKNNTAE